MELWGEGAMVKEGGRSADCRVFSCSGQPVSRARSTCQAIDWLHWFQLLEVSAEAGALACTHPHKDEAALTLFLTQ